MRGQRWLEHLTSGRVCEGWWFNDSSIRLSCVWLRIWLCGWMGTERQEIFFVCLKTSAQTAYQHSMAPPVSSTYVVAGSGTVTSFITETKGYSRLYGIRFTGIKISRFFKGTSQRFKCDTLWKTDFWHCGYCSFGIFLCFSESITRAVLRWWLGVGM